MKNEKFYSLCLPYEGRNPMMDACSCGTVGRAGSDDLHSHWSTAADVIKGDWERCIHPFFDDRPLKVLKVAFLNWSASAF